MTHKTNPFWMITSTILLALLVVIVVPRDAIAQYPTTDTEKAIAIFENIFRFVENNYVEEIDTDVLLEGALDGLFKSLDDPHSTYLTDISLREVDDTTSGEFGGVGMYISKEREFEDKESYIQVISPIKDTPSDRLGIRANDLIVEIDGITTADMSIDDAVNALRGLPGEAVAIKIMRRNIFFDVVIVREVIEVPTIRYALIPENSIGYIRIIQFTPFTYERIIDALREFDNQSYQSLIIDVRQNPGGLLSAVVDVADTLFDGGLIVGTRGRNQFENRRFNAKPGSIVPKQIPIVLLVDQGSASASEILAGALKDRNRATIIGQKTFGKGSVQQIKKIGDSAFRLTMSKYYTPNGDFIDQIGIIPDIIAESEELSEMQTVDLAALYADRAIEMFVNNRKSISDNEIARFVNEQTATTSLTPPIIRRLIKNELQRANNIQQAYDLEFDTVLQQAIEFLQSN